jgi:hypothetical protein
MGRGDDITAAGLVCGPCGTELPRNAKSYSESAVPSYRVLYRISCYRAAATLSERRCRQARARIIELTPRGRQALRVMRSSALDLEKRWQEILGRQRLGELRKILQALLSPESPESAR